MKDFFNSNPWPINIIIMAGGKGTRLWPLTENTHKSLIEIADKPVIIHLIEHLESFGFNAVHISVGHLSGQVINFIEESRLAVATDYILETTPMGSIGSLSLKNDWPYDNFMVLNGDIFTNFNILDFISTFFFRQADMAVLTYQNHMEVPWGILDVNSEGEIVNFSEKPTFSFQINAGVYLFNRRVLELIPTAAPMQGWELVKAALGMNYKLVEVPMNEGYWVDIGTIETLSKAKDIARLKYAS